MSYFVYIIQSEKDGSFYRGFTEDPKLRLQRHNNGESVYTRIKNPWNLVYLEELPTKTEALKREKALKKYSHEQIHQLIHSTKNQLNKF